MSPTHRRTLFVSFALLIAGVAVNVMVVQPMQADIGAGRSQNAAQTDNKTEAERRRRLALERGSDNAKAEPAKNDVPKGISTTPVAPRAAPGSFQPTSTQIPMEQGPRRFARLRTDAGREPPTDKLPDAPDAEGDPETIKAVQRELTARGYGPLTADAVPGLVTRAAIMAFEHDRHMALTGEATERVLERLTKGPAGGVAPPPDPAAGRVRSPQAELVIRTVQQSLAALGYQVGRIDGKTGDDITRAIREFELDQGLPSTGRVSAEVFSRLGRVVAAAKPKTAQ